MDDQLQSLLVQALIPGASGVLGQDGDADPTALLTQYLLQRQTADDDETDDDEDDVLTWPERAELEDLRRRNEIFAAAVGACEICWGDDPACPICWGDGRPGVHGRQGVGRRAVGACRQRGAGDGAPRPRTGDGRCALR